MSQDLRIPFGKIVLTKVKRSGERFEYEDPKNNYKFFSINFDVKSVEHFTFSCNMSVVSTCTYENSFSRRTKPCD